MNNKILISIIVSAVLLIAALSGIIIYNYKFDIVNVLLGLSVASLLFSIIYAYSQKRKREEFDKYFKSYDCNSAEITDLKIDTTITDNYYINKLIPVLKKVSKYLKRQKKFSEDVAHELKTPLTILRGELELALRNNENQCDCQMIIASALDEVIRITKILESILDIAKAEAGKISVNRQECNVSGLFYSIVDDAKILADRKNIEIKSDIKDNVIAEIDDLRMHQALLNLIENAIKYTPENGKIDIELDDNTKEMSFRIKDNGIGIPKDKQKYIFERFFQIKEYPDAKNGIGIGLSIVKWIVDKHDGLIDVHSEVNKGTEFIIKIPKQL